MGWHVGKLGLAALPALWFLSAACDPKPTEEACGGNEICQTGQRCVGGVCRFTCGGNITCPDLLTCMVDVCLPSGGAGSSNGGVGSGSSSGFVIITGSSSSLANGTSSAVSSTGGTSSLEETSSSGGGPGNTTSSSSSTGGNGGASSSTGGVGSSSGLESSSTSVDSSSLNGGTTSSSSSSTGGISSSSLDCAAQAKPCFTGTNGASGCTFTYACPNANQVCVAPNNTCMNYNYTPTPGSLPGGTCERRVVAADQKVYVFCNIPGGWFASNRQCAQLPGFQLASLDTLNEYNVMAQYLFSGDFWIGMSNRADSDPPYVPAPVSNGVTWVWLDGTPVLPALGGTLGAFPWCGGQPDQSSEHCVEWKSSGDCWNNKECGSNNPFVCSR